MINIGCHLSASSGFSHMLEESLSIGANTFQFFTRNPRGGRAKDIDKEDVENFLSKWNDLGYGKIVAHAPYTLNMCSDKESTRTFAKQVFADDLKRMEFVPGNYYNFHPGSHVGQGTEAGIELISETLNELLFEDMTTTVLLETMAGKGSEVGGKFEELREIIDRVSLSSKLGVCLDTCHVFDAGYDIVNGLDKVLEEFDRIIGLEKLKAVHLNDSKNVLASHKDRHEKIGEGNIGLTALTGVVNHEKLKKLPFILETPNDLDGYKAEIELISKYSDLA
ncbi:MAG: deoxyribonuclease IV [Clostridia bacterium]|nr:deoxyribonuclease IV [Clostridia bacterium]